MYTVIFLKWMYSFSYHHILWEIRDKIVLKYVNEEDVQVKSLLIFSLKSKLLLNVSWTKKINIFLFKNYNHWDSELIFRSNMRSNVPSWKTFLIKRLHLTFAEQLHCLASETAGTWPKFWEVQVGPVMGIGVALESESKIIHGLLLQR